MGEPMTTLTGTRCGPSHEKSGLVMPTFLSPHLQQAHNP